MILPLHFASGTNRAGEIRGFADLDLPFGIVVDEVIGRPEPIAEIVRLAGTGLPVFVDSGAFSEVAFGPEGPRVVRPISDAQWKERLDFYEQMAEVLGSQLYVVAPDKVGFADETIERLDKYREQMKRIANFGARVLVVLQGSDKVEFLERVKALNLGYEFIPSLPCQKNATSNEAIVDFVERVRPGELHLLGRGLKNKKTPPLLRALDKVAPDLKLSLDSCLMASMTGKTNGPGGGPRKLTRLQGIVNDEMSALAYAEGSEPGDMEAVADYTDVIAFPSEWITAKGIADFARYLGLDEEETKRFKKDPDGWLQEPIKGNDGVSRIEMPDVATALDAAWVSRHKRLTSKERKRRAVRAAFKTERRSE